MGDHSKNDGLKLGPSPFCILFVDDEESQRKMFRRVIKDKYLVETAGCMGDAVTILKEYKNNIAVIVSDMKMPEENGLDLLAFCCANYPEMTRIVFSAYAESSPKDVLHAVNNLDVHRYLQKPLSVEKIRDEMDLAVDLFFRRKTQMVSIDSDAIIEGFNQSCEKWLVYLSDMNESIKCLDYGVQAIFNEYDEKIKNAMPLSIVSGLRRQLVDQLDDFMESEIVQAFSDGDGKYLKKYTKH